MKSILIWKVFLLRQWMFQVCHTLCAIISVWNAILAKSWDLFAGWAVEIFLRRVEFLLWAVEGFIMKDRKFLDERSRFSWWTVEIFWMNGRGFLDKRWRFSWWTVQSFMMNDREFHDERSNFSRWTVKIFMMNGRDFLDERSRFSWWTVKIVKMTSRNLTCPELLIALIKIPERGAASRHPAFMGNCSTISHTC